MHSSSKVTRGRLITLRRNSSCSVLAKWHHDYIFLAEAPSLSRLRGRHPSNANSKAKGSSYTLRQTRNAEASYTLLPSGHKRGSGRQARSCADCQGEGRMASFWILSQFSVTVHGQEVLFVSRQVSSGRKDRSAPTLSRPTGFRVEGHSYQGK